MYLESLEDHLASNTSVSTQSWPSDSSVERPSGKNIQLPFPIEAAKHSTFSIGKCLILRHPHLILSYITISCWGKGAMNWNGDPQDVCTRTNAIWFIEVVNSITGTLTWFIFRYRPVEPHEAVPEVSKGKVHITQNKHVPIEWFVTTASQSRIWLKLLSDDSNKVGICLLCRSTQLHATTSCRSQFATTCDSSYVLQGSTPYYKVLLQYYSVLHSTNPVILCTTQCYSSTTLYCKVLLQYYSVLQSTTPVLLRITQCYSSTTLYYKVLLQYYSVLQSTTPVLLQYYTVLLQYYSVLQSTTPVLFCTTKYYSSTTLYYKVLIQYYSVLQSTTPVLLQYYTVLLQYYSVLQSTTPVLFCTTKYYKLLLQYYSVLQSTNPVLLCTTK